ISGAPRSSVARSTVVYDVPSGSQRAGPKRGTSYSRASKIRPICASRARARSFCCACGTATASRSATMVARLVMMRQLTSVVILIAPRECRASAAGSRADHGPPEAHTTANRGSAALQGCPERPLDVYLIDGTYELFRHYYAVPRARDAQGREVGAVRG